VRLEDGGKDDEGRLDGGEVADGVPLGTKLVEGRADTLGLSLFGNVGQSDTEGCAEGCPLGIYKIHINHRTKKKQEITILR